MAPLQDPYPHVELASPPPSLPLRKPSLKISVEDRVEYCGTFERSTQGDCGRIAENTRDKHESYNLTGSIFLVTSAGKTLNLPVPSASPADPLTWSRWKTSGAIVAVAWYSAVSLTAIQAASQLSHGISVEFHGQVCSLKFHVSGSHANRLTRIQSHGRLRH